jgi:hypothetical protein
MTPLAPADPATAVFRRRAPLELAELKPVVIDTAPPVVTEVLIVPAERTSSPPEPLSAEPTDTYTDPALP